MSRIIGIDLGTTNSCVAVMDGDRAVVIANAEGARTTPSVVGFVDGGERLVGRVAKRQAMTNPEHTVYAIKRLMGRKLADPAVPQLVASTPYEIVGADNGDAHVLVRGRSYAPPEISAMILDRMRHTAEDYLGEPVTQAVVTVPAYFDDAQRQATKDAGRIAGLEILRIINEPTAAALAYGLESQGAGRVVVYDLGGGTFDVSILELAGGVFQVRATAGDTFLGGEDFDNALMGHLMDCFARDSGIDLRGDKLALQRLKEESEKVKQELSSALETEVHLPFIAADASGPKHLQMSVTRKQLEGLVEPLVQRTLEPCRRALADSNLGPQDVDVVILVGGQSRMPRIQELVSEFFGRAPHRGVNPDEVVAVGAAIQAGVLSGQVDDVLLLDVTPLSLGVETAGGVFTTLIERNTTVPTRATEVFSTALDNQDFVNVHVLQGEREMAEDNKSLANFQLVGIPPAPRGVPRIEVTFDLDADGMLTVSATDLDSGAAQSVKVVPSSGLGEADIQRLIDEASHAAAQDQVRRELAEARIQGESLLYTTNRALTELGHMLGSQERARLANELSDAKRIIESGSLDEVRACIAGLDETARRIGEIIYAQAAQAEPSGAAGAGSTAGATGDADAGAGGAGAGGAGAGGAGTGDERR